MHTDTCKASVVSLLCILALALGIILYQEHEQTITFWYRAMTYGGW